MAPSSHAQTIRRKAYLAGPLFTDAERTFNVRLAASLETLLDVYLPQRDGGLMSEMVAAGVPCDVAASHVFERDLEAIRRADYMIAILDGRTVDEGVAFELGIAFSHAKRCLGLQTDTRRLATWGNNPMITGALEIVFSSVDELLDWLSDSIVMHHAKPVALAANNSMQLSQRADSRPSVWYGINHGS